MALKQGSWKIWPGYFPSPIPKHTISAHTLFGKQCRQHVFITEKCHVFCGLNFEAEVNRLFKERENICDSKVYKIQSM